jgi:hypothetical protein
MQIFVNGMEVAFTQHNETYINEVLVGFKNWLEKKIDDVQKIEVTALSKLELMLKNPADGDNPEAIKNAALSIMKLCENGLEELKNGKN